MKPVYSILLFFFLFGNVYSNINSINLDKISFHKEIKSELDFIITNQHFYNHWMPQWNYEYSKSDALNMLKKVYKICQEKAASFDELLLTGEIAHYQYNLSQEKKGADAIKFYKSAIKSEPYNYKGYWFLANHFSHAANRDSSVFYFKKAESLNLHINESAFWEEYAFAFYLASMPSHTIKAMDKSKTILKEPGYTETVLGNGIRQKLKIPSKDSIYSMEDIWGYNENTKIPSFVCRAMGIKMEAAPEWDVKLTGLKNQSTFALVSPNREANTKGDKINYSIAIIAHVAKEGETLESYIQKLTSKYSDINKFSGLNELSPQISYEIYDTTMYTSFGGGHMHIIGFEKNKPEYPGLLIESPLNLSSNANSDQAFYKTNSTYTRVNGKIYYAVVLDTCADIYLKSFRVFEDFLGTVTFE